MINNMVDANGHVTVSYVPPVILIGARDNGDGTTAWTYRSSAQHLPKGFTPVAQVSDNGVAAYQREMADLASIAAAPDGFYNPHGLPSERVDNIRQLCAELGDVSVIPQPVLRRAMLAYGHREVLFDIVLANLAAVSTHVAEHLRTQQNNSVSPRARVATLLMALPDDELRRLLAEHRNALAEVVLVIDTHADTFIRHMFKAEAAARHDLLAEIAAAPYEPVQTGSARTRHRVPTVPQGLTFTTVDAGQEAFHARLRRLQIAESVGAARVLAFEDTVAQ